ncbi:MAG: leucine-rich repeat domain-containing protein [Verrucomicrobiota bacterium]
MRGALTPFLLGALLWLEPAAARAQLTHTNAAGSVFTYNPNPAGSNTIAAYSGTNAEVIIPATLAGLRVSGIGTEAFVTNDTLTNVTISGGVSSIGTSAFEDCVSIASVTIPGTITNMGVDAFAGCTSLASLTISNGVPSIGEDAFYDCVSLASVTIPASVTNIQEDAFEDCSTLTNVFFTGGPPIADPSVFPAGVTVYYVTDTDLWTSTFADRTALFWNALIQAGGGAFGVQTNQFGFDITGTLGIPVVVEACTNLANPVWSPLLSLTLTNGEFYFSEPLQTNPFGRYYRLSSP